MLWCGPVAGPQPLAVKYMTDAVTIPPITVTELIDRYEMVLLDAYGVLVHGGGALPGAAAFLDRLNRENKPYYILTNDVAKLPAGAAAHFRNFGLDIDPLRIISAGVLLEDYFAQHGLVGKRCAVVGTEDSAQYAVMAGGEVVAADADFEVLVVADESGYPFLETVEAVLTALFARLDRGQAVDLILPNPDLIFPTAAAGFGLAAGSIALVLEAALQLRYPQRSDLCFARLGKPYPMIFEAALQRGGNLRAVMVGDQLQTDIRGANDLGIDSVLITGGVSVAESTLYQDEPLPTYLLDSLEPPA